MPPQLKKYLFLGLAALCAAPAIPSAAALIAGILFALVLGNPLPQATKLWSPRLMQASIIGMGGAMNFLVVTKVGAHGLYYTAAGILATFALGHIFGRILTLHRNITLLVCSGTAICGGSAIAAVSAVLQPKATEISVSLVVVFLLNALALLVFPPIGHALHLSQQEFGLWSALAIHDTSSVVGAAMQFGAQALEIATTVKLARALWIMPMALVIVLFVHRSSNSIAKIKKPWFILGFLATAAIVTWIPTLQPAGESIAMLARRTFVVTLFLVGSGFTREAVKDVGLRPFLLGISLWICVSVSTLVAIRWGWIS